jgi:hypothetical protein
MGKDHVTPARETVASLVMAAEAIRSEAPGGPRRAEAFERLLRSAENYGSRWGDLVLEVKGSTLEVEGAVVHEDESDGTLAGPLAACGVRKLTIGSGVAREELESLAQVMSRAGEGDEDIVCWLWRAQLWAVTVEAEDDSDHDEPATVASVAAIAEALADQRKRARTEPQGALAAAPPVGRDLVPEGPPPEPGAGDLARSQALPPEDLLKRVIEIVRAGLWRSGTLVAAEDAARIVADLARRALEKQDLALVADILDRADPPEAPAVALKAGEKLAQLASPALVQEVPALYAKVAEAQGEDAALAFALRCLGHLDSQGVQAAASAYADVPAQARRPLRRLLSARGGEALEAVMRLAEHRSLEVAKDGFAILAVIPLEKARQALERLSKDPATPRDRIELVRAAHEHALSLAGKKSAPPRAGASPAAPPSRAGMIATLVQNLRDPSQETRLAAARSLAKLGPDPKAFEAIDALVKLPGFADADGPEQDALITALSSSGGERAIRSLELLVQRTLGLPVHALARAALENAKNSRKGAH